MSYVVWTEEAESYAKAQWLAGDSAAMIAVALAEKFGLAVSRSAVLGKMFRAKLAKPLERKRIELSAAGKAGAKAGSGWTRPQRAPPRPLSTPRPKSAPAAAGLSIDRNEVWSKSFHSDGGVALVDLRADMCRWPLGDPRDVESFRYCGAEAPVGDGPYCAGHKRLAYSARAERKPMSEEHRQAVRIALLRHHAQKKSTVGDPSWR